MGSFVDARSRAGRWLVRIEDLDTARVVPGCAQEMLRTLAQFGLEWDGPVEFQSRRTAHYAHALEVLRTRGVTFECSCSRADLEGRPYPGTCRTGPRRRGATATRFAVEDREVLIDDRAQGRCFRLHELGGHPKTRRRLRPSARGGGGRCTAGVSGARRGFAQ